MSWLQLLQTLDHSITIQHLADGHQHTTSIPQLPPHTLFVDAVEMAVGTSYIVTGFVPKRDYPFVLGQRVYTIPLPTIVYRAKWHDGQISKLELAVTLEDEPQEDTQLYRWPFSNVYDHLGVCWSTSQAECQALKDVVEKGVFGFLQTPNNADLFRSAQCSSYESYSDFLQVVEQEGLHKEWLKPLTFTVAELQNKN